MFSRNSITNNCKSLLVNEISGVVQNSYMDNSKDVKAFVIIFTNGKKYTNPVFLKGLNGLIESGDSIYKPSGLFKYFIFRKTQKRPFIHDENVDCKDL